jgi:hypothetical protein
VNSSANASTSGKCNIASTGQNTRNTTGDKTEHQYNTNARGEARDSYYIPKVPTQILREGPAPVQKLKQHICRTPRINDRTYKTDRQTGNKRIGTLIVAIKGQQPAPKT